MYFTGFADEAAADIDGQIKATKTLNWQNIEARNINGTQIHDLSDADFDTVAEKLAAADIKINCFGSAVANWAKKITDPFDSSLAEARRAIPRMQKLSTRLIRIMSFAVLEDRQPDDQMQDERFRRLRELVKMFADAGITAVHENCMNYGGMSWHHTLELLENVPGLKLVFDTGNPVTLDDRSQPKPYPKQSSWDFYRNVREHIEYVHIKDAIWDPKTNQPTYTFAGDGQGNVKEILRDLLKTGYDGGISMEPHLAVVFHDPSVKSSEDAKFNSYVEYGRRFENLLNQIQTELNDS
ncbi:MAG: sugar phosphate isomerase/epimerase [Sedimentisphaerales bacterium]|nr:sugar phosphate isomerase/epimerase [Sedimentisphaerales bacterium]